MPQVAAADITRSTWWRQPPVALLLLLLLVPASLPVGLVVLVPGPVTMRTVTVAAIVFAVGTILWRTTSGQMPVILPQVLLWLLALLVVALVSAAAEPADAGTSFRAVVLYATVIMMMVAVISLQAPPHWYWLALCCLVLAAFVVCVPAIAEGRDVRVAYDGALVEGRAQGLFAQPNDLGSFSAAAAALSVATALAARSWILRFASLAAAALSVTAVALSFSRGALLGTAVGLATLVLLLPQLRRPALVIVCIAAPAATWVLAVAPSGTTAAGVRERVTTIASAERSPYDERPGYFGEALRQVRAAPLLGVGPAGYPAAARGNKDGSYRWLKDVRGDGTVDATGPDHAHNILLTTAAELGLPGALLLLGFVMHVALHVKRTYSVVMPLQQRSVVAGTAAALVTVAVHGMFDYVLRNPLLLTFTGFLVALLLGTALSAHGVGRAGVKP